MSLLGWTRRCSIKERLTSRHSSCKGSRRRSGPVAASVPNAEKVAAGRVSPATAPSPPQSSAPRTAKLAGYATPAPPPALARKPRAAAAVQRPHASRPRVEPSLKPVQRIHCEGSNLRASFRRLLPCAFAAGEAPPEHQQENPEAFGRNKVTQLLRSPPPQQLALPLHARDQHKCLGAQRPKRLIA